MVYSCRVSSFFLDNMEWQCKRHLLKTFLAILGQVLKSMSVKFSSVFSYKPIKFCRQQQDTSSIFALVS